MLKGGGQAFEGALCPFVVVSPIVFGQEMTQNSLPLFILYGVGLKFFGEEPSLLSLLNVEEDQQLGAIIGIRKGYLLDPADIGVQGQRTPSRNPNFSVFESWFLFLLVVDLI